MEIKIHKKKFMCLGILVYVHIHTCVIHSKLKETNMSVITLLDMVSYPCDLSTLENEAQG